MSDVTAVENLVSKHKALKQEIAKIIIGQDVVIDRKSSTCVRIICLSPMRAIFPKKVLILNSRFIEAVKATYHFENSTALVLWTFVFALKTTVSNIVLCSPKHSVLYVFTML